MAAAATAPSRAPARRAPAPGRRPRRPQSRRRVRPQAKRRPATGARARPRANRALVSGARSRPRARVVRPAVAGAAMIPVAAVRTAGAVRDLSDSSLIVRLTRGRGWIGLLSVLLFGIVALNVVSLSLNAGSGRVSLAVEELERQNSGLRAQLAEQLSASRVQGAAETLGLAVPAPEDITYLTAREGDADRLAELLGEDSLLTGPPPTPSVTEPASYVAPSSPAPAAPSLAPAAPAPSAPAPSTAAPAPSPGAASGSGGVGL